MTTYYIFDLWVIPKGICMLFHCGSGKCVRTLHRCTQVTELKHWGLCPVHVCTSRLLSSGSHGKSGRLTLRIGFFSGSLNGLGYSLRVRVHWLGVELFNKGVPLLNLCTLCGLCQSIYAVKWTKLDKQKGLMEGFDEIGNKGLKGETRPMDLLTS